jgi:hypothetical protein
MPRTLGKGVDAVALGVPECPEFARWTASSDRVRIVTIAGRSGSEVATLLIEGLLFRGSPGRDCASAAAPLSNPRPPSPAEDAVVRFVRGRGTRTYG